jgi:hypothetical protein
LLSRYAWQAAGLIKNLLKEENRMAKFVFVYLGGNQPSDPEEASKHFSKYMDWLSSLGDTVVIPTIPLKDTNTVSPDGTIREGGSSAMSGFSIIEAESMEAALGIARSCPFLEIDGSLEVSEMMEVPVQ